MSSLRRQVIHHPGPFGSEAGVSMKKGRNGLKIEIARQGGGGGGERG